MRFFLFILLFLGVLAGPVGRVGANAPAAETLRFKVFLEDERIGTHSFQLKELEEGVRMESKADFEVKFLFLTAYEYRHRSQELWQGGCLKKISSQTDDNGERYSVRGEQAKNGFLIVGATERIVPERCAMTFAYWDRRILEQERLINPQTGEVIDVEVTDEGTEQLTVDGRQIEARRYRLTAENLEIRLWYDDSERWLGLESRVGGDYRLSYRPL
jgi:hypothetical protein